MDNIKALIDKYKRMESDLESQLADIKDKLTALTKTAKILSEETVKTDTLPLPMITASKKYEDMSMGEAILDLLNNHLVMEAKEIQIELLNNGFKSVSKTLLGDIYGRLSQLVSDGKIITFKDGKNFKKYKIATSQTNL
jgi:hypothetical protein